jgi:protein-S-isoprenylcysteine O-methyltransferase Ste14
LVERAFVWLGGAVFVAALAFCAVSYLLRWSVADGGGWGALASDALLVSVFAAHHSLFAREHVKRRLAQRIPDRLLRSVYVWTASLLWLGTCAGWRLIGGEIFHVTGARIWLHAGVQLAGVWVSAGAVRGLHPLELAGIRPPSTVEGLQVVGPYRIVRHPLYLGWILMVFGAAHMTGDRLAFAALTTLYLVLAIPWEERSLVRSLGADYTRYQRVVRWRVIPFIY